MVAGAQLEAQLNGVIVIIILYCDYYYVILYYYILYATLLGSYSERPKASPRVAVSSKQCLVPHKRSVHIC